MFFFDPLRMVHERKNDSLSSQLSRLHFSENETGIIFIGNSLMDNALPLKEQDINKALSRELQKQEKRNISVSTFNAAMGDFSAWDLKSLKDEIMNSSPSVIVVQSEVIVARYIKEPELQERNLDRIGMWSGLLERRLLVGLPQSMQDQAKRGKLIGDKLIKQQIGKNLKVELEKQQKELYLAITKSLWSGQNVSDTSADFLTSREFIQRALSQGIRVIVLELPVSRAIISLAPEHYFTQRTAAIRSLSSRGRLVILRYPRVLPDEYFRDFRHLRPRGRREFLEWFIPALARELM